MLYIIKMIKKMQMNGTRNNGRNANEVKVTVSALKKKKIAPSLWNTDLFQSRDALWKNHSE